MATSVISQESPPASAQKRRRILIGVQTFLWGYYFIGLGLLLAFAAVRFGGLGFWPLGDGELIDPKDVFGPNPIGAGAIYLPTLLVALTGGWAAAIAAVAGAWMLSRDRTWPLIISTALTAAMAVVQVTPFGFKLLTWLLD